MEPQGEGEERIQEPDGGAETRKTGPLNKLSKPHMNSQSLKQQAQGLQRSVPGSPHTPSDFQFRVLMGFPSM